MDSCPESGHHSPARSFLGPSPHSETHTGLCPGALARPWVSALAAYTASAQPCDWSTLEAQPGEESGCPPHTLFRPQGLTSQAPRPARPLLWESGLQRAPVALCTGRSQRPGPGFPVPDPRSAAGPWASVHLRLGFSDVELSGMAMHFMCVTPLSL